MKWFKTRYTKILIFIEDLGYEFLEPMLPLK